EELGGSGRNVKILEGPGFHDLDLDTPGIYAGIYQHRGNGPMPVEELSKLDVRIISKDSTRDIPVMMNSSGQTFSRWGVRGMPLFNVLIERPGFYSLSALYKGSAAGPSVSILFFAQSAQNTALTLMVGGFFFLVFLGLGIFVLVK